MLSAAVVVWYNRLALFRNLALLLALVFLVVSAGCTPSGASSDALGTATLRPYAAATASPRPSAIPPSEFSTSTPGPTSTPFSHVVQDGETLLYIAYIHGITLETLLSVNPGIDPRFLSVGHELIIPLPGGGDAQDSLPLVTPVPAVLAEVSCYRTPSNGLWCLTSASGGDEATLEGLAALITLYDAQGERVASVTAYGPVNLLAPGKNMPLATFFTPPAPEYVQAVATLLSAFVFSPEEERYLEVETALDVIEALPGSTRWRLSGTVSLAAGETGVAERISVLVIALGANGEIVGFNVWESAGAVSPGEEIDVDLELFSLGPSIAGIEVLAEAQASQ